MIHRFICPLIFVLGLAIGIGSGLDQMILGRSRFLIDESVQKQVPPPEEVRKGLDGSYSVTTVTMYLGVAVCLVAVIGAVTQSRHTKGGSDS